MHFITKEDLEVQKTIIIVRRRHGEVAGIVHVQGI